MADRPRAGIDFNFTFGKGKKPKMTPSSDSPFRMLILGDFGGHASRGQVRPGAELRPQRVDMDSLPALVRKIAPKIQIKLGEEPPFVVAIHEIDDFHPDHLFATHAFFTPMRELRKQLQDPKTFAIAAAMLGSVKPAEPAPTQGEIAAHGEDLQRLLGRPSAVEAAPSPNSAVDSLIRQAVAPHVVGKADPRQADLVASVDGMTGELMRALLHDPGFKRVEVAWRGLDRVIRALELDESMQVFVLDISREEMAQDFVSAPGLADTAIYRIVVDHSGDKPWSLLVATDAYERKQEDAALLARLGAIAQEVDASVIAGMDATSWTNGFTSPEDQKAWAALRGSPAASSIAVALPNVLLRLPYGKDTEATERFVFTEQTNPPTPGRYLWGSAALAVAQLLAQSYLAAGGWDFAPGDECSLDDLPTHITKQDGESVQTPCAQIWLPESKLDALIKEGLMPMVSAQGRGEVRVPRFQSLASPPTALAGRWRNE
jgi:type VI secretion system protein ImpC